MKFLILTAMVMLTACSAPKVKDASSEKKAPLSESTVKEVADSLITVFGEAARPQISKGVKQVASLWRESDGSEADFRNLCKTSFVGDPAKRSMLLAKLSRYFESITGHFNKMTLDLRQNVDLDNGELLEIDKIFSGYSIGAHLMDDLYANKIAFVVALNFPYYSLDEKENLGKNWSREAWAAARLGDMFVSRIPAEVSQKVANAEAAADLYIAEYNIKMGSLRTEEGASLFPENMSLLSHWNLRDEIKADYADAQKGQEKQRMIYSVMQHIIRQDIPACVINNASYQWKPLSNKVSKDGKEVATTAEPDSRYQQILNNFHAQQAVDAFEPQLNTLIKRKFSGEMEIRQEEVEQLFDHYLRSPQLVKVGQIIAKRLGRPLEPFDIWYDGFKARSAYPQDKLNGMTTAKYPDPKAFEKDMPNLLMKLGWSKERAAYLSEKIVVDPARGSGHAWGAGMKGEKAHLRTRVAKTGMDYKGYNIAVHEFGHNVEQSISMYDVDDFLMNGVPNTAFTEALAFIFQSRDLFLLGLNGENADQKQLGVLDASWTLMEIMGVGLVDMRTWKWLYEHPTATAPELKQAVIEIASKVWNDYFSPVFNQKDQPILAIYSHMISSPLYLAAYSYGQIIEFQIEDHLVGKVFPNEIDRIYKQGRLIPQIWMEGAVGSKISADPILKQLDGVLNHP
ncbi:MAG: hypothetical protein LWW85_14435 [Marinilabiliales bacterium]|nr:hypothetical protein [Marinilabiliales bacterium]